MSHFPGSTSGRGRHPYNYSPYNRGRGRGRGGITKPPETDVNHTPVRFDINGITFELTNGGSKLNRTTPIEGHPETPAQHEIAGVKFFRTKGGNLLRHKEYHELELKQYDRRRCDYGILLTSDRLRSPKVQKSSELCAKFSHTGSCTRDCRFTHDYNKVAACKTYLLKGECPAGVDCSLSHDLNAHRTPMCIYFARGNCTNDKCQYVHFKPASGATVCYDFARLGYCEAGSECTSLHIFECPDFANTGKCKKPKCHLPHVERAGQLRRRAGATNGSDANSDDNDSDSGTADHPAPPVGLDSDDTVTTAFSQQADYIALGD